MTDLVYDYISMGVDMILTAAVLSAVVVLLRSSVVLSAYQANLQANSDRMNYYKRFNMYDCTNTLCSADVLSALIYYRYDLQIVVVGSDGGVLVSNDTHTGKFYNGLNAEMTIEQVQATLKANWTYSSNLVENGASQPTGEPYSGGLITGIKFTKN